MNQRLAVWGLLVWYISTSQLWGQQQLRLPDCPPFHRVEGAWARNTLNSLSLEEKIGQLFMVAAYTYPGQQNWNEVQRHLRELKPGGVMFMKGTPNRQLSWANSFQAQADIPLLVSQDAEWGVSMRLGNDSAWRMPNAMTLGAVPDFRQLEAVGREMARQCRAVGVQVNFAPVVDVNNNPRNPVINERSFGQDKLEVLLRARQITIGLQAEGVMACAKHFPGHGNTSVDSHLDLPVLNRSLAELDTLEFVPFRDQIAEGVLSVMVAHLYLPQLEPTPNLPASLSRRIVTGILRGRLGFKGLIFTDALNMLGVSKHYAPGELEVRALEAGVDVLLFSDNPSLAFWAIQQAVMSGRLTEERLDSSVLRILLAKEALGLHLNRFTASNLPREVLRRPQGDALRNRLYREAATVALNRTNLLPLQEVKPKQVALLQIGREDGPTPFYQELTRHFPITLHTLPRNCHDEVQDSLLPLLNGYRTVILALQNLNRRPMGQFGIRNWVQDLICRLQERNQQVVVAIFGNPYAVEFVRQADAVVVGYEENEHSALGVAELVVGAALPKSLLPVTPDGRMFIPPVVPTVPVRARMAYQGAWGLDSLTRYRLDTLLESAVQRKATPGCALMVLHRGQVAYSRGYGQLMHGTGERVDPYSTRYDLASLTKVLATTLACMRLYEERRLELDAPLGRYLTGLPGPKRRIKIRQLLTHSSGLPAFVPFWQRTLRNGKQDSVYYCRTATDNHRVQLGTNLYLLQSVSDSVWDWILEQPLRNPGQYVYSDLGFLLLQRVVEALTHQSLEMYVNEQFYKPLGLQHTCFNPVLKGVPASAIPPTVMDWKFRYQLVQGFVNDECAALLGGVAGHAGLFGSAWDVARILEMIRRGGAYGGRQYFKPETVALFTAYAGVGRRGLGWDKPDRQHPEEGPCAPQASEATFGHLGFTGTCAWADPERELVYVLLSNRTYPDADNVSFVREAIRKRAMEIVYQGLPR